MLDTTQAPAAIVTLVAWLKNRGFTALHQQSADFSNQYVLLTADDLTVEITASRGEWSIGIGTKEMGCTFGIDEWEAWLDHVKVVGGQSDRTPSRLY